MTDEEKEYLKQWLYRANEDISVVDALSNQQTEFYTSTICFHCQQAVEKFFKAFLVYNKVEFPKTHDVDFLLIKCKQINNIDFEYIELKDLSDFGVDIRYPDDFYIPDLSETNQYIEIAKSIKSKVEKLIKL